MRGAFRPAGRLVWTRRLAELAASHWPGPGLGFVLAPTGYGKSALIQALAKDGAMLIAWGEEGPVCARRVEGGWREEMRPLDLSALLEESGSGGQIFFDDYDAYATGALSSAIEGLASTGRHCVVIAAARRASDLAFSAATLISAPLLTAPDLAWTHQDILACLNANNPGAPRSRAEDILRFSDGWPAAARRLCAIPAQDFEEQRETLAQLAGGLLRERHPELSREALRALALLPRIRADVLEETLDRHIAGQMRLAQARLVIQRRTNAGDFVFVNRLFRETWLREPVTAPERDFLLRAAALLGARNHRAEAIECVIAARDDARALAVLKAGVEPCARDEGRLRLVIDGVKWLGAHGDEASAELRLWSAWALRFAMRPEDARAELERVRRDVGDDAPEPMRAKIEQIEISIASCSDDTGAVLDKAARWLSSHPGAAPFETATVAGALAVAQHLHARRACALRSLDLASRQAEASRSPFGIAWTFLIRAMFLLAEGRIREAERALDQECFTRGDALAADEGVRASAALLQAFVRAEAGEYEAAENCFGAGDRRIGEHALVDIAGLELSVGVWIEENRAGLDGGLAFLEAAEHVMASFPRRILIELYRQRILLSIRHDRAPDARDAFDVIFGEAGAGPFEHDLRPCVRHVLACLHIQVLVAEKRYDEAIALLRPEEIRAEQLRAHRRLVELKIAAAAIAVHLGGIERVRYALAQAARIAAQHGMRRVFLEHAPSTKAALEAVIASRGEAAFTDTPLLGDLAIALGAAGASHLASIGAVSLETLTAREREMLFMLDGGMSNAGVAEALALSTTTVKWHLQNIYRKLDVKNRTSALARARRLGLLASAPPFGGAARVSRMSSLTGGQAGSREDTR